MKQTHFSVYKHTLVISDDKLITRHFITLKHPDGTMDFTDFHKYIRPAFRNIRRIESNDYSRFIFVCQFLNHAFFTSGITKLSHLQVVHAESFLNAYAMCELPDDDDFTQRNENTVKRCCSFLMDFYIVLIREKVICAKEAELYIKVPSRDRRGRYTERLEPVFSVRYQGKAQPAIFRDIPDKAFRLIFHQIATKHTELLALIALGAFAGLRPSEACNVRRTDSPLGPGILFSYFENTVEDVEIDLTYERNLRSDLKSVGSIKKERRQKVPLIFLKSFVDAYNTYMKYMEGRIYEAEYAPLTVNRYGKALTYDSYYQKFQELIQDEMIGIFLESGDPELVLYGRTLMERRISPHIFRHWYTVQLVLAGVTDPGELMYYRGDKSPESALSYLREKGELEKRYMKVNELAFEYLMWETERKKET